MDSGTDSRGNRYFEFDMTADERIRVTRIAHAEWAGGPTLRVQKRRKTGHVVQGPEFPASVSNDLAEALRMLAD